MLMVAVICIQGCRAKKKVWERSQKLALLKQLQTHFKAKHGKGVGTPLPRVPAPLHPCMYRKLRTIFQ